MRIPSGDLAPARRRRRHGYGRRRGRTPLVPVLLVVVLVAALAGGTWFLRRDPSSADALAGGCGEALRLAAVTAPVLPAPGQVRVVVLNGTGRDGLGRTVAGGLAARGFGVPSTGNAPAPVAGASRVVFGPGGRPAATLVAAQVVGAGLVPAPGAQAGSVVLTLGSGFVRLRTPQEAAAWVAALPTTAPAAPRPRTARPTPSASPAPRPC